MKSYSPYQFSFFRIILGIYLIMHFMLLIPYGTEIWSNLGILPDASLNLTHGYFPNFLNYFDDPWMIKGFIGLATCLSILFTLGIKRQWVAIVLWYIWVCLFDRNNLISNPGIPFVGWLLLCCACIPAGEPWSLTKQPRKHKWVFPKTIFIGAWVIMALSYTISGLDKLMAPSWQDGTALFHLLENPLARDWWFREALLMLPMPFLKMMTWGILALEILFLPLAIFKKTRKWVWITMIGMHLGILLVIDFADLTLGMLMIHWFTFDGRWFKPKRIENRVDPNIVFFDGVCGLCDRFIRFLMREDRSDIFAFAPLQGKTAAAVLPYNQEEQLSTMRYISDEQIFEKSDAVIKIMSHLGGIWKVASVFLVVPKTWRDGLYDFVAERRNNDNWISRNLGFKNDEACEILSEADRRKLLE